MPFSEVFEIRSLGLSNIIINNNDFTEENLRRVFDLLLFYGFRRVIFTLDHDVTTATLSSHLLEKKKCFSLLKRFKPRGMSVYLETNVVMSSDSIYEKQIRSLSVKATDFLFVSFPTFDGEDWIDQTLNYLLYKQRKFPCFMSFDRNISTYSSSFVDHLMKTRASCFMVDINSFAVPKLIPRLEQMIDNNSVIVPGICGHVDDYTALDSKLDYFRSSIGQPNFVKFLVNSSKAHLILLGASK